MLNLIHSRVINHRRRHVSSKNCQVTSHRTVRGQAHVALWRPTMQYHLRPTSSACAETFTIAFILEISCLSRGGASRVDHHENWLKTRLLKMVAALKQQQNRDASHNPKRILHSNRVYWTSIPALCAQFENELMEIRTAQHDRLFWISHFSDFGGGKTAWRREEPTWKSQHPFSLFQGRCSSNHFKISIAYSTTHHFPLTNQKSKFEVSLDPV